jgi:hypothetical protein
VLVQRQVGDELLELVVFLAELPELPHLGDAEAPESLLPAVEGRLTHPELPADLLDRGPGPGWRRAIAICSGLYRLVFMVHPSSGVDRIVAQTESRGGPGSGGQSRTRGGAVDTSKGDGWVGLAGETQLEREPLGRQPPDGLRHTG